MSAEIGEGATRTVPTAFVELKVHSWEEEEPRVDPDVWRMRERMKTVSVAIVLCLNVGVDPPDVVRPRPCARLECWIDPHNISQQKAIEIIGLALQKQYERWQPRARYKLSFDPTVEEIRKVCISLRKNAKDERVLFHYNGHGVPKPTENGEIWVFNKMYTQYIPLSLFDLQTWMGSPGIYVWDCNGAGIAVNGFRTCAKQHEKEYLAAKLQRSRRSNSMEQSSLGGGGGKKMDVDLMKSIGSATESTTTVTAHSAALRLSGSHGTPPKMADSPTTADLSDKETTISDADTATDMEDPEMPKFRHCIQLAACGAEEVLPSHPELPADLFTCCLTTPLRTSVLWYILNNRLTKKLPMSLVDGIPGQLNDRRTPLGELNWIFTAITDTIAWNTLPQNLFQRLFRQDLLVASLFRNFLLAERIMRSYKCKPISSPRLPPTHDHVMWEVWDHTLDVCLSQLVVGDEDEAAEANSEAVVVEALHTMTTSSGGQQQQRGRQCRQKSVAITTSQIVQQNYVHSDFFSNQLTAFEVWLRYGFHRQTAPEQLPIILQVLLSQVHRLRALELLSRFLDLGRWAVNLALAVGIFPYVLRLLQSLAKELRPVLTFIWAKVLAVDRSCQMELLLHDAALYFIRYIRDGGVSVQQKVGPAFVLAALVHDFAEGQKGLMYLNYVSVCSEQLNDCPNALLRQWLVVGLACVWSGCDEAKWQAVRCNLHEKLFEMLQDPVAAVRASVAYALGCFMRDERGTTDNEQSTHLWHTIVMTMVHSLSQDGSAVVRRETLAALHWFIVKFENQFVTIAYEVFDERRHSYAGLPDAWQATTTTQSTLPDGPRCESFANLGDLASLVDQIRRESSMSNVRASLDTPLGHDFGSAATSPESSSSNASGLLTNPRASMARLFGLIKQSESGGGDSAISRGKTEPSMAVLLHDRKQRSRDGTFHVGNVYVTVWRAVMKFTVDPDYKISHLANRLVTHVAGRVLNLRRSCTVPTAVIGRRVTVADVFSEAKASSPVQERHRSPARKTKFTIGTLDATSATDTVDGMCKATTEDSLPPMYSAYSIIYTSPRRPVFGEGPSIAFSGPSSPSKAATAPVAKGNNDQPTPIGGSGVVAAEERRKALIETGFINTCIQSFKLPIVTLLSGDDCDEPYPRRHQTLSSLRNDALIAADELARDQWSALNNKEQFYNNVFTCRDDTSIRCVRFFPVDPVVCLGSAYTMTIWNWDTGTLVTKFDNDYSEESMSTGYIGQMVHVDIVNSLTHGFVLTGTDQGIVRLWDAAHALADHGSLDGSGSGGGDGAESAGRRPALLTAWASTDNVFRLLRQPITNYFWEQEAALLFVGGDFRHLLVWNGHKELKEADLPLGTGADVYVSSVSSDSTGHHLTAAGCSDGSVRLFDRRLPTIECRIMTLRDLEAPVCKVHVERAGSGSRLVAGSARGQLCVWDPRLFQEPVTLSQIAECPTDSVCAFDVHSEFPLIAAAVAGSQVNVVNANGQHLGTVRHHESFVGQKSGTIACVNFHPIQVNLGIGETDFMFTMYSVNM